MADQHGISVTAATEQGLHTTEEVGTDREDTDDFRDAGGRTAPVYMFKGSSHPERISISAFPWTATAMAARLRTAPMSIGV